MIFSAQCTRPKLPSGPQVLGDLLRGVLSVHLGDPMVWGSQSWGAEMWDLPEPGCPCELMRKAAEKWNQGSFTALAWEVTEPQKHSPVLMSSSDL